MVYNVKNLYHDWTQDGPEKASFTSEKGWMEVPLFLDQMIFVKETTPLKHCTRVLMCDGHPSHQTLPLVKQAKENNVAILRLPAHLTI